MPTHAHPWNNNIAPMPTQNPWAWVGMGKGMGMGTQCRALLSSLFLWIYRSIYLDLPLFLCHL
jgi:hypothetical protein